MDLVLIHLLTHSFTGVFHTVVGLNLGSDLGFYLLPTVLLCGYYYYLYIYINPVSKRTVSKLELVHYLKPI